MTPLLILAFLAAAHAEDPSRAVQPKPADARQEMTPQQIKDGLTLLSGYLDKRGEDPSVVGDFIRDLETKLLGAEGGREDDVTRGTFSAFLKYEEAWARKTRDGKNPEVSKTQLEHERKRAQDLKKAFYAAARKDSPRFYAAFRAAIQEVRAAHAAQRAQGGGSAGFFSAQVDDSYTKVDAGDEALDQGDTTAATADASQAIAENPSNADAYALKSGAEYTAGDLAAAAQDAQQALALDPANQQAQAVQSLASSALAPAGAGAVADAQAVGQTLAADASGARAPSLSPAAPVFAPPSAAIPAPASSVLPALSVQLSNALTQQAARTAGLDPAAAAGQLDQAIALNPSNYRALNRRSALANGMGDYKAGLDFARRAVAAAPEKGRGYFNEARSYAGLGERDHALDALRQAAAANPKFQSVAAAAARAPESADLAALLVDPMLADAQAAQAPAPPPRPRRKLFRRVSLALFGFGLGLLGLSTLVLSRKS